MDSGNGCGGFVHVSIPNGLPRPFSPSQSRRFPWLSGAFQSRTGSPGHLARHPSSIAQEALVCKRFRESLYSRVFSAEKGKPFWPLFSSIRFWRLPRVYAQRRHHCDSRKADLLKERVRTTALLSICPTRNAHPHFVSRSDAKETVFC